MANYVWSPDHSTFIDLDQNPGAKWYEADQGGGSEGAPARAAGFYTGGGYNPDSGGMNPLTRVNQGTSSGTGATPSLGDLFNQQGFLTYDQFMGATPEARNAYLMSGGGPERTKADMLRNVVPNANSWLPLSLDQYKTILGSSNLDPTQQQSVAWNLNNLLQEQDASRQVTNKDRFGMYAPALLGGIAGLANLATTGAVAAETGGAAATTGGATGALGTAEAGSLAGLGAGASDFASLVGPATGAIESAPVIGAAGAPTASAVASGAGPFIPTLGGLTPGLSNTLSSIFDTSASGGATAAPAVTAAPAESLVGPATGTVEAAPTIGASGIPAVTGTAAGAGEFVPAAAAGTIPVAAGGAMDMTGSSAFPTGASAEGMGGGSIFQGTAAGGLGSASAGGTAAAGGGTALSRILDGTATTADYLSLGGNLGATALGVYGANQQSQAMSDLADKYLAIGAPSRARYESSFAPGFSMTNEPGYQGALDQTTEAFLRKASMQGNPAGNPGAWAETLKGVNNSLALPALYNYRNQNASTGGYNAFNTAAPGAATGAINAGAGVYNAIGAGAADVFNPRPAPISLNDIYRAARGGLA